MSKLQKKPAAHIRGHPTLQNIKFKIFLLLWGIFALLDPDPDPLARLNPDPIRIRNPATDLRIRLRILLLSSNPYKIISVVDLC
jgi:hypothetical protein